MDNVYEAAKNAENAGVMTLMLASLLGKEKSVEYDHVQDTEVEKRKLIVVEFNGKQYLKGFK